MKDYFPIFWLVLGIIMDDITENRAETNKVPKFWIPKPVIRKQAGRQTTSTLCFESALNGCCPISPAKQSSKTEYKRSRVPTVMRLKLDNAEHDCTRDLSVLPVRCFDEFQQRILQIAIANYSDGNEIASEGTTSFAVAGGVTEYRILVVNGNIF